jgi:RNA polymerase sigma factor (TIGR02999 family)
VENSYVSATGKDVTSLLIEWRGGNAQAFDEMAPLVYEELRRLARTHLRRERPGHTLQCTALVHEAWLRMIGQQEVSWQNRSHFYGVAAQMIRRILVDHARARRTHKRGDDAPRISLDHAVAVRQNEDLDLVALDDALNSLASIDPRQSRLVELRYFAGLSIEETAEVLEVSTATVKRDWLSARAWLRRELLRGESTRGE